MKNHAKFAVNQVVFAIDDSDNVICGRIDKIEYMIHGARVINKSDLMIEYTICDETFLEDSIFPTWAEAYKKARATQKKEYARNYS